MQLLQIFFAIIWAIGCISNTYIAASIEWSYISSNWIRIFDPLLQVKVLLKVFSDFNFLLFLMTTIIGQYGTKKVGSLLVRREQRRQHDLLRHAEHSIPEEVNLSRSYSAHSLSQEALLQSGNTVSRTLEKGEVDNILYERLQTLKKQTIELSIKRNITVQFNYVNRNEEKGFYTANPVEFKTIDGSECLRAFCCNQKRIRVFLLDKIIDINFLEPGLSHSQSTTGDVQTNSQDIPITTNATERPYMTLRTERIEEIAKSKWNDINVLQDIFNELRFRSTRKARNLRGKTEHRISELLNETFRWPSTMTGTSVASSSRLSHDVFPYETGLLRHYGYKVGINGLEKNERLRILDRIFLGPLEEVNDNNYMHSWGQPNTAQRLKKLADSIATFTRNEKRRNTRRTDNVNSSQSVQHWESDLSYLKKRYYENRFSFSWPNT
jgi:hypothetical protein